MWCFEWATWRELLLLLIITPLCNTRNGTAAAGHESSQEVQSTDVRTRDVHQERRRARGRINTQNRAANDCCMHWCAKQLAARCGHRRSKGAREGHCSAPKAAPQKSTHGEQKVARGASERVLSSKGTQWMKRQARERTHRHAKKNAAAEAAGGCYRGGLRSGAGAAHVTSLTHRIAHRIHSKTVARGAGGDERRLLQCWDVIRKHAARHRSQAQTRGSGGDGRTCSAVNLSGALRSTNSLRDSPFSTTIIGGSGVSFSGGGMCAVEHAMVAQSMLYIGGMMDEITCMEGVGSSLWKQPKWAGAHGDDSKAALAVKGVCVSLKVKTKTSKTNRNARAHGDGGEVALAVEGVGISQKRKEKKNDSENKNRRGRTGMTERWLLRWKASGFRKKKLTKIKSNPKTKKQTRAHGDDGEVALAVGRRRRRRRTCTPPPCSRRSAGGRRRRRPGRRFGAHGGPRSCTTGACHNGDAASQPDTGVCYSGDTASQPAHQLANPHKSQPMLNRAPPRHLNQHRCVSCRRRGIRTGMQAGKPFTEPCWAERQHSCVAQQSAGRQTASRPRCLAVLIAAACATSETRQFGPACRLWAACVTTRTRRLWAACEIATQCAASETPHHALYQRWPFHSRRSVCDAAGGSCLQAGAAVRRPLGATNAPDRWTSNSPCNMWPAAAAVCYQIGNTAASHHATAPAIPLSAPAVVVPPLQRRVGSGSGIATSTQTGKSAHITIARRVAPGGGEPDRGAAHRVAASRGACCNAGIWSESTQTGTSARITTRRRAWHREAATERTCRRAVTETGYDQEQKQRRGMIRSRSREGVWSGAEAEKGYDQEQKQRRGMIRNRSTEGIMIRSGSSGAKLQRGIWSGAEQLQIIQLC